MRKRKNTPAPVDAAAQTSDKAILLLAGQLATAAEDVVSANVYTLSRTITILEETLIEYNRVIHARIEYEYFKNKKVSE